MGVVNLGLEQTKLTSIFYIEHFYLPTDTHNAEKRRVIKTF